MPERSFWSQGFWARCALGVHALVGVAALGSTGHAADRSGVRPSVMQTPSGPGSIEGLGEAFEANSNTGQSSYAIKVQLPPAVAGFTPEVTLNYSSGSGNGPLGVGWSMGGPSIQRGTDRRLPRYDAEDVFVARGVGGRGAEDLVQMADGSYRYRIEGAFVRAQFAEGKWSLKSKSGIEYLFGTDATSQVEDGEQVFQWCLSAKRDTNGNLIRYDYTKDGGQTYLERITFNDFSPSVKNEVRFIYEQRPDPITSYLSRFAVTTGKRLVRIEVLHAGEVVRSYHLSYQELAGLSRLGEVRLVGRNGQLALPTLSFQYAEFSPSGFARVDMMGAPARAVGTQSEMTDVNGDALPDLLVMDENRDGGRYVWYENRGGKSFLPQKVMTTSPSVWLTSTQMELADMDGDSIADIVALPAGTENLRYYPGRNSLDFAGSTPIVGAPSFVPGGDDGKLVDLNHDRLSDLLMINPTTGDMTASFNLGDGRFGAAKPLGPISATEVLSFANGLRIADFNGDGLSDLAVMRSESARYWPSLGLGEFAPAVEMTGAPTLVDTDLPHLQVRDLNGDGLTDLVVVGVTEVRYWLNLAARGFSEQQQIQKTPVRGVTTEVRVADMNGNGTADLVWIDPTAPVPWQYIELFPNGTPGLITQANNGMGKILRVAYAAMGEARLTAEAAGLGWKHRCPIGQTLTVALELDDSLGNLVRTEYIYGDGYFDAAMREFRGFGSALSISLGDESQPTLITRHEYDVGLEEEARKGLTLSTERTTEAGESFDKATTNFEVQTVARAADGTPLKYASRVATERSVFELGTEAKLIRSTFQEDEFGNVVLESAQGEVQPGKPEYGDDERTTRRTFAKNEAAWILDRASAERVESFDGTLLSETHTFYDGKAFEGLGPDEVERGNPTRVMSYIDKAKGFVVESGREFDQYGNAIAMLDARGMRTEADYHPENHTYLVEERQFPSKGVVLAWRADFDMGFGVVQRVEGPNGEVTEFAHDALSRVVKIIEPGDSLELPTQEFEYALGAPISALREERRERSGEGDTVSKIGYYDGHARLRASIEEGAEAGAWVLTQFESFGPRSSKAFEIYPTFVDSLDFPGTATTDLSGKTYRYDALQRLVSHIEPDGATIATEYAPLSKRVWDEHDTDKASPHYDTPTLFESDGLERLRRVTENDAGRMVVSGEYTYDARDLLTTITDANQEVRRYRYDGRKRRTALSDPNAGAWEFEYADSNDLVKETDPTGRRVHFTYDKAGRVLGEWHQLPGGEKQRVKSYHYDQASEWYPKLPNLAGQLAWVEDEAGEVFFGYTKRSLESRTIRRWKDGTVHDGSTQFDAMDRVSRRQFPDGSYYSPEYDGRGLVKQVGPFASNISWNPQGLLAEATLGNGVAEKRSYDARYRLTGLDAKKETTTVRSFEIGYSLGSLLESITDRNPTASGDLKLDGQFEYDDRYRLVKATDTTGATRYKYDDMANVLKVTSTHEGEHLNVENAYADAAGPERRTTFGKESWKFDAAGRLVSDGTRELAWDAKGRLASVVKGETVETYTYDHADARAVKVTKTAQKEETTRYIAGDVEERAGKLVKYVYLGDKRLARFESDDGEGAGALVPKSGEDGTGGARHGAPLGWLVTALGALVFAVFGARQWVPNLTTSWVRAWVPRKPLALSLALGILVALSCGSDSETTREPEGPPKPEVNLTAKPPPGVEITELPASVVFYSGDYQESPVALTNAAGKVTERSSYHPYGTERGHEGKRAEPYGYVGNERDASVGLSDFGARPYRAEAGVFLKPDPVAVFEAETLLEQPIRLSAYTYGSGDSITRMDASGKIFETVWDVASLAMGVVSLKENIAAGHFGSAVLDAVGVTLDAAAVIAPGIPGGASAIIKASRAGAKAADKVVDATRVADKVGDAKKVVGGGGLGGGGGAGRGGHKLKPDPAAEGPHSTFRQNAEGKTSGHAEWTPNSRNPSGFDQVKRVDTQYASPHSDRGVPTPHTHGKDIPGGVRPAHSYELPR